MRSKVLGFPSKDAESLPRERTTPQPRRLLQPQKGTEPEPTGLKNRPRNRKRHRHTPNGHTSSPQQGPTTSLPCLSWVGGPSAPGKPGKLSPGSAQQAAPQSTHATPTPCVGTGAKCSASFLMTRATARSGPASGPRLGLGPGLC